MTDFEVDSQTAFPLTSSPVGFGPRRGRRPSSLLDGVSPLHDAKLQYPILSLSWRAVLAEWLFIATVVYIFCYPFLGQGLDRQLPGNEQQNFQMLDTILVDSLAHFGQFPLWNPYIHTGAPLVADPFLHLFNPLATLPVLLFGVSQGFKIGLFLSFLAAGLGMWWQGGVLGMGRLGRIWIALMYAFTGQAAAKFFQGQYDFILGYAWIPWAVASVMAAVQWRRPWQLALSAVSIALVFFSGNGYYAYYMAWTAGLLALLVCLEVHSQWPFVRVRADRFNLLLGIGTLALGVAAIQLLPTTEFWPYISKGTTLDFKDSQSIGQVMLDYLSPDPWRKDALQPWFRPEEYYAYTGIWPFLAAIFSLLASRICTRRYIAFFCALFVFVALFADIKDMPWREWYLQFKWLYQFRYPTRMLIFGAFAIVALGGLGVDALARRLREVGASAGEFPPGRFVRPFIPAIWCLLGLFLIASVVDLYQANSPITASRDSYMGTREAMAWLRAYDPSDHYVSDPGDWSVDSAASQLRYFDGHYGFGDVNIREDSIGARLVKARPKYAIGGTERLDREPGAVQVQRFQSNAVYLLPRILPFAFGVSNSKLMDPAGGRELGADEVAALPSSTTGPNSVQVTAEGDGESTLVVLSAWYPGWEVRVDGERQQLQKVSGYLATDLKRGNHTYSFEFHSMPFTMGMIVSLLSLAICLGLTVYSPVLALFGALSTGRSPRGRLSMPSLPFHAWRKSPSRYSRDAGPPGSMDGRAAVGVYRNGTVELDRLVDIPDGSRVMVRMELFGDAPAAAELPSLLTWSNAVGQGLISRLLALKWEWVAFVAGLGVYLLSRVWDLDQFPIYFFTDEAAGPLYAEQLLANGFRSAQGALLPVYFEQAPQRWMPLLSVYFHVPGLILFGKSILAARGTAVLVGFVGAGAAALLLKFAFRARLWWAAPLILAVTPTWFLHSRTAFETVIMVSAYSCLLLFYLLYRTRSPRYIYATLAAAGVAFYAYSNGQAIVGTLGLALLVSDFRYHLRNWRILASALPLGIAILLPLAGFRLTQPDAMQEHLRAIGSYWLDSTPLDAKLLRFAGTYLYGISPQYWFISNNHDLSRHLMKGMGHIHLIMLPFVAIGLALCLHRFRTPEYRAVVFSAMAVPVGAAVAEVGITRVLAFVVPAALLATLGLDSVVQKFFRRVSLAIAQTAVFVVTAGGAALMLHASLTDGPLWYRDYGLYGMQYGAKQLFGDLIPEVLRRDKLTSVMVSPSWANGTDKLLAFFVPPSQRTRVQMFNIDYYLSEKRNLTPNTLLVMTPEEYQKAKNSPKLKQVDVEQAVPWPDGRPGFYVARIAYADNVDAIIAQEREQRRQLVSARVNILGQQVVLRHSQLDMGEAKNMFDGNRSTLARGMEANPFILEFDFPSPQEIHGLVADFASMDFSLVIMLYSKPDGPPTTYLETYRRLPGEPHVEMTFDPAPEKVSRMRVEITNLNAGDKANIHIREFAVR